MQVLPLLGSGIFMRMNPPTFHDTNVDEHQRGFVDELFKVVDAMGVNPTEISYLAAYQLKDVPQVCFEKSREERTLEEVSVDLEVFKMDFLDCFPCN